MQTPPRPEIVVGIFENQATTLADFSRKQAYLHALDGGHWALETNLDEIVVLARDFLGRVHTDTGPRA